MDIVKTLRRKSPVLVTVLDFELQVWRYPGRLDRGDIGTDNLATREFVGKVTIPLEGIGVLCLTLLTLPKFLFRSLHLGPFGCPCQVELDAIRRLGKG